jgi:hypothetical protein
MLRFRRSSNGRRGASLQRRDKQLGVLCLPIDPVLAIGGKDLRALVRGDHGLSSAILEVKTAGSFPDARLLRHADELQVTQTIERRLHVDEGLGQGRIPQLCRTMANGNGSVIVEYTAAVVRRDGPDGMHPKGGTFGGTESAHRGRTKHGHPAVKREQDFLVPRCSNSVEEPIDEP